MFITKIISIYKHFDFFNIRKMLFEMQEFVKHNKTENCELPKTYYTFCNLRLFKPDYKFDSTASNRRFAKQLSNYELNMLKDISFYNSNMALKYAYVLQQPVPELESIIAQKSDTAALYACDILSKRFELGEKAISTSAADSYLYASLVLNDRFLLGEPILAKGDFYKREYEREFGTQVWRDIKII